MALDLTHLPAEDEQPREKFKFEPWMFAVILAVVLVVGAIVIGYLRNKNSNAAATTSSSTAATASTPVQTVTSSGNDVVNQGAFDSLEANLGQNFTALQNANASLTSDAGTIGDLQGQNAGLTANAAALQSQIAQLQTQLQAAASQGQDITALTAQIAALQAQLTAIANKPAPAPTPAPAPAPAPAPVTTAPPPQSNGSYVTVQPWPAQLSTLWGIAQSKYGNGALWPRIAAANPWISNPNIIQPGWRIFVPGA